MTMAGVRLIRHEPERYLVTFRSEKIMDNGYFSVVEMIFHPHGLVPFCRTHESYDDVCVKKVLNVRGSIGYGERPPADEGY